MAKRLFAFNSSKFLSLFDKASKLSVEIEKPTPYRMRIYIYLYEIQ